MAVSTVDKTSCWAGITDSNTWFGRLLIRLNIGIRKKEQLEFNLGTLLGGLDTGDLVLIRSAVPVDMDLKISPFVAFGISQSISGAYVATNHKSFGGWDKGGIILKGPRGEGGALYIAEATENGIKVSEFVERTSRVMAKGGRVAVRRCMFHKDNVVRATITRLITSFVDVEFKNMVNGASGALGLRYLKAVRDAMTKVDMTSNSMLELRRCFAAFDKDGNGHLDRSEVGLFLREFSGGIAGLDYDVDSIMAFFDSATDRSISFEKFAKKWAEGPGQKVVASEVNLEALLCGEFLRVVYTEMGVIKDGEHQRPMDGRGYTPDDFSTANMNLVLEPQYEFEREILVKR
eukprot:GILK01003780.1.p1 GENE.GILK01003780.1~~GILK01003780.1.p1  ORF type:complete len:347 (+),score=53.08 GILK01003780.1:96-1136(+)